MPDLLVRDLDKTTIERLKLRAEAKGRSLQQEAWQILTEAAPLSGPERAALIAAIHAELGFPKVKADPAILIRQDREGR
jgi:plasmid stability protein